MRPILTSFFFFLTAATAHAGCDIGGFFSRSFNSISTQQSISYLSKITEERYDEMKRSGNTSIFSDYLDFSSDYDSFRRSLQSFRQLVKFDIYQQFEGVWAESSLSPEGLAAYQACLKAQNGLHIVTKEVGAALVVVDIIWSPAPDVIVEDPAELLVSGDGNVSPETISLFEQLIGDEPWSGARDLEFVFRKVDEAEPAFATIKVGGTAKNLLAPPRIEIELPPAVPRICSCSARIPSDVLGPLTVWGPEGQPCWGRQDAGTFSTHCKPANTVLASCVGHPHTPHRGVVFYGPENELCVGQVGWPVFGSDNYGWHGDRPVIRSTQFGRRFCPCKGDGNVYGSVSLWGPEGADCGGLSWGQYQCPADYVVSQPDAKWTETLSQEDFLEPLLPTP